MFSDHHPISMSLQLPVYNSRSIRLPHHNPLCTFSSSILATYTAHPTLDLITEKVHYFVYMTHIKLLIMLSLPGHCYRGELSYLAPVIWNGVSFGGGYYPPDWVKHHASQSQDRNNKYFISYIEFVAADLLFQLARMWHAWKGECYLTVLVFHGRYYFYSLKFTLMFINEIKRNANTYLISNFDSLEAVPSNLPP